VVLTFLDYARPMFLRLAGGATKWVETHVSPLPVGRYIAPNTVGSAVDLGKLASNSFADMIRTQPQ
jgi:hypothetical protein